MESQHNNNNNPPTNHRDRHAIPNPSNRSHPVFSLLKPLNLGTRPFLIQNHAARGGHSIHIPPLNVQINQLNSLTHLNTLSRPVLQPTQPIQPEPEPKPQIKCQFCNESYDSEDILGHASDCDMQRISCERCGDRVPMDVYDVHFEECSSMDNRMEAIEPRSPVMYRRNMNQMEDDEDSEEPEVIDEMDMYLQEDSLSYEQLLRLDENVVKKGMTEEQMKEFKVQLYVKSLDGEGTCRICICDYETAEYTRELSCRHKFHKQCIDKWLDANITCPMCKKYLR